LISSVHGPIIGQMRLTNSRSKPRATLMVVVLAIGMSGCMKRHKRTDGSGHALPDKAAPAGVLDACAVGTWKSSEVRLSVGPIRGTGGANVALKIDASGACTIDFTPMTLVVAVGKPTNFDFHYVGKATGRLRTSDAGVISAEQLDYSGLRAFADVHMAGGVKMPLLTNVSVTTMVPTVGPKVTAASSGQGIDSTPVLSADSYACTDSTLTLSSKIAHTQWSFSRIAQ
jgi:hypothetical protein